MPIPGLPCPMSSALLLSFLDISTNTGNLSTIVVPSSVLPGDLMMLADFAYGFASAPTSVTPSGWITILDTTISNSRLISSYKIALAGDAGSTITGMAGNIFVFAGKVMLVFRGNKLITSVVVSTPGSEATDGNPAVQTVTLSGVVEPFVVIGLYYTDGSVNAISPRTFTIGGADAKDNEATIDTWEYVAYRVCNAVTADVSIDMEDEGAGNILQSFYMRAS